MPPGVSFLSIELFESIRRIVPVSLGARSIKTKTIKTYENVSWAEKNFAVFLKYGPCPEPRQ
jgi:hypothetical protein